MVKNHNKEELESISRRSALSKIGTTGLATSLLIGRSSKSAKAAETCTAGNVGTNCGGSGYPIERSTASTYSGTDIYGNDMSISLGTGLTQYDPVWTPSTQKWNLDFSVCGTNACRNSDGSKSKTLWWQETVTQNFDADIYTRNDDIDWNGSNPHPTTPAQNWEEYSLAMSALSLSVGALNPAAGTAFGAAGFANSMANWVDNLTQSDKIRHKWDYDTSIGTTQYADAGTFMLFRAEMAGNESDSFNVKNFAVAQNENIVSTGFDLSLYAPAEPDSLSTSEYEEAGIQKITPEQAINNSSLSRATRREMVQKQEPVYVADSKKYVDVSVDDDVEIPERIYEEINNRDSS